MPQAGRFVHIFSATSSMYLVTHILAFCLLASTPLLLTLNRTDFQRTKRGFTRALFAIVGARLHVSGRENIAAGKSYLIVANYPGSYAGFALMHAFPEARPIVHGFMAWVPLLGLLLRRDGAVFVSARRRRKSLRALQASLRQSRSAFIFPEGGRTPDGQIKAFRHGFLYLLRHSELALLPVTLKGFYQFKPMRRFYLDPAARLEVVIHPPVSQSTLQGLTDAALLQLAADTIGSAYRP